MNCREYQIDTLLNHIYNTYLQAFIFDLMEFDRVLTCKIDDIQHIDEPSRSEKRL